jgi:hypothetical protein
VKKGSVGADLSTSLKSSLEGFISAWKSMDMWKWIHHGELLHRQCVGDSRSIYFVTS